MSFGLNGSGSFTTGVATGIYSHAIDTENRIVIAYNNGSNSVAVARYLPDGSGLDISFGTGGFVTSLISGISGNTNIKVTIDANNQVVVAAVVGTTFVINRYSSDGTSVSQTLTVLAASIGGDNTNSVYTLAKLLIDTDGKAIITAYDAYPAQNLLVVFRTTATLSGLDTAVFNSPNGYIQYQVSTGSTQVITDSLIHPDGRIVSVGYEN